MTALSEIGAMVRPRQAALAALVILSTTMAAMAGDVADLASEAENLLQSGDPATAFDTMDAAVDAFWQAAPLIIKDAHFVPESDSAAFSPGDKVGVYLRPLGYGFKESDGGFQISLSADVEIRTPGGLILAKSEDFAQLEWSGPGKNRTFAGRISIDMPDLKPGDYALLLTLTDDASDKTTSVTLPFAIAAQ